MFIRLSDSVSHRERSDIQRPLRVTVEADTPAGSAVIVVVDCVDATGQVKRAVLRDPVRQPAPTLVIKRIGLGVDVPEGSLAIPFIYTVVIEFNGWKNVYEAKDLFDARDHDASSPVNWQLMVPEIIAEIDAFNPGQTRTPHSSEDSEVTEDYDVDHNVNEYEDGQICPPLNSYPEKPYLTVVPYPGAVVTPSSTRKPFIIDVDGGGYADAALEMVVCGHDAAGVEWSHSMQISGSGDAYKTTRDELPISTRGTFGLQALTLRASSDGAQPASLSGLAIEGDGRRFYIGAADLVGDVELPDNLELLRFSNSHNSILTLKPQVSEFFGFPTAMTRLAEMIRRGELNPDWTHGDPLTFGMLDIPEEGELTDAEVQHD